MIASSFWKVTSRVGASSADDSRVSVRAKLSAIEFAGIVEAES